MTGRTWCIPACADGCVGLTDTIPDDAVPVLVPGGCPCDGALSRRRRNAPHAVALALSAGLIPAPRSGDDL